MVKFYNYRKQTHTDRYLNYRSHHTVHVKRGIIKSLYIEPRGLQCMKRTWLRNVYIFKKFL